MNRFGIGTRYLAMSVAAMVMGSLLSSAESQAQRSSEAQDLFGAPVSRVVSEGPVRMVVDVDRPVARVAEPITLAVRVEAPRRAEVTIQPFGSQLGELEVTSTKQWNALPGATGDGAEIRRWVRRVQLESIRPGEFGVPSLEARYRLDGASAWRSLRSEPLKVQITSVASEDVDPRNFRDLKPAVDVQPEKALRFPSRGAILGGVFAAVAVFAAAAWWLIRRRRPDPAAVARSRIGQLAQHVAAEENAGPETDSVHLELEKILRDFLASRFDIPAHSQATDELLRRLKTGGELGPEGLEKLESILVAADEIKYAPGAVPHGSVDEAFAAARQVVDLASSSAPSPNAPAREAA